MTEIIKPSVYAILEDVRSLHNVGACFRTSECAGLTKLFLAGYTGFPPRKEIDKTALGADKMVPWEHHPNVKQLVTDLKEQNITIIALEHCGASKSLWDIEIKQPVCLIFGNEIGGVSPGVLELADIVAHLPLFGNKTSMNISVAFGIAVYEVVRRLST
jgi:tRNA G18 (ribose-2'-O)-methylase SpoU